MQGQLGTHACLGCLLYSVSVLYNVDTFICIKRFCILVISFPTFYAIFRSLHFKVVDLERTAYMDGPCLVYINFGKCNDDLELIDRVF
jgi:hypothetical protein